MQTFADHLPKSVGAAVRMTTIEMLLLPLSLLLVADKINRIEFAVILA